MVSVPWPEPALDELKVGVEVKDNESPSPLVKVSVKVSPPKVTLLLFSTVIVYTIVSPKSYTPLPFSSAVSYTHLTLPTTPYV